MLEPIAHPYLQDAVEVFSNLYKVPERWDSQVDTIGHLLVRRLFQFLEAYFVPHSVKQISLDYTDLFLSQLMKSLGNEPFAFAMTWWVAALANQEAEALALAEVRDSSPILNLPELLEDDTRPVFEGDLDEYNLSSELLDRAPVRSAIDEARSLRQRGTARA